jgi:hypothetical protein
MRRALAAVAVAALVGAPGVARADEVDVGTAECYVRVTIPGPISTSPPFLPVTEQPPSVGMHCPLG